MPIGRENWRETVLPRAEAIQQELAAAGIRVTLDERDERPGWKFAEWELRGVPLRLEIGPKDIEKSQVLIARRDTREKLGVPMDGLPARIASSSRTCSGRCSIVRGRSGRRTRAARRRTRSSGPADGRRDRPGFVIAPWCGSAACEAQIKADTQATIRNMPLSPGGPGEPGHVEPAGACIRDDGPAQATAWFAKAY